MVIDKLTSANYKLPVATDNSNLIKSLTVTPTGFGPSVVITTTTTVTYTATDYKDLTATCSFEIKVRGRLASISMSFMYTKLILVKSAKLALN